MAKLNQLIAIANGEKGRAQQSETEVYHKFQKATLFSGLSRKYSPKDEEGEDLPPETKKLVCRAGDLIKQMSESVIRLIDLIATIDNANTNASASVVVDGTLVASLVPVTTLLFLEKRMVELHTFVGSIPTLDPSEDWTFSPEANCYATAAQAKVRTKKAPKAFVKYQATKEHPAQVEMFNEDVIVGTWDTRHFSGAIPESEKTSMLNRVKQLQDAIKSAREDANSMEVKDSDIGKAIFNYVFVERPQS